MKPPETEVEKNAQFFVHKIELFSRGKNSWLGGRCRKVEIAFVSKGIDLVNTNLTNRRKEPIKIICHGPVVFAK